MARRRRLVRGIMGEIPRHGAVVLPLRAQAEQRGAGGVLRVAAELSGSGLRFSRLPEILASPIERLETHKRGGGERIEVSL
jgi:hypothetical protein